MEVDSGLVDDSVAYRIPIAAETVEGTARKYVTRSGQVVRQSAFNDPIKAEQVLFNIACTLLYSQFPIPEFIPRSPIPRI